jgi:DNA-binding winged helix-turn-helix (wHTH) protein
MSRNTRGKIPKNSDRRGDDGSTMTPADPADPVSPGLVQFDSFTLDLSRRVLSRRGERIHLTAKPLDTLIALVMHPGETVGKHELMEVVWKNTAVTEDVLVQAIGEIRRALGEKPGEDRFIQTVPRQGYRFVMPVRGAMPSDIASIHDGTPAPTAPPFSTLRLLPLSLAVLCVLVGTAWLVSRWVATTAGAPAADRVAGRSLPNDFVRLDDVSAYGTIHAGGVVATVDGDQSRNAEAVLEWRAKDGAFIPAHPLERIDDSHFVGSLFWLTDDTAYEVRVTVRDPDGVTGRSSVLATLRTERDTWPEPSLGVLHVSPAGRDSNTGASPDAALRTIQRAADLAKPGDIVLIHPGVYRESVRIRKSGTWIQPIVFRGAGPDVILDGTDEQIATNVQWKPNGDGIYAYDADYQTTHVSTELGRLFNYSTLDDLRALRAGDPGGFFSDKHRIYVKFADRSSPALHSIHAGRLDYGFMLENQSWVALENLEFRYFGGALEGVAVFLKDCTACRVYRCRFREAGRAALWVQGGERGRIEENEISDTSISRWAWHDSNASDADNHGIYFTGQSPRGYVVRRNRIRGTFDGLAPCGTGPPSGALTTETDVYDNDFSELGDDGIEAEPYCSNLRIWGNRISSVMMGISTAPAGPGPTWILRNVAYRFGAARGREVWLASALKVNTLDRETTGPLFVYHNTFVTDIPNVDAIALLEPGQVTFIRARNNVMEGTRHAMLKLSPIRWDGDGNVLHTTSPGPLVEWLGAPLATIEDLRRVTNQERAGLSAPPQLADPPRGDFTPRAGSPLIDRGIVISGINERFAGRGPDIGAIESRH